MTYKVSLSSITVFQLKLIQDKNLETQKEQSEQHKRRKTLAFLY
jgi:hypothetical protein